MTSVVSVVVHPNRIYREGLTSILAKSPFAPACTASSTEDVPSTIAGAGEQVLVLIGVDESSNVEKALSTAKTNFPDAHVVVVGDANKRDIVATAIALGATSFVDENLATTTLIKELELAAQGEPVISVLILKRLLGHCPPVSCGEAVAIRPVDESEPPDTQEQAESRPHLSSREATILNALMQGMPNKVIANQLKISEATVKVHIKAILRKIRVKNRTQAAIWAQNCQAETKSLQLLNGEVPSKTTSLGSQDAVASQSLRRAEGVTKRVQPFVLGDAEE